jgi:hypothetical protein
MKRFIIIALMIASYLSAYELSTDSWGRYTVFDPDQRVSLLSYPTSWLKPGTILFEHNYEDSTSSYAKWDQFFMMDRASDYVGTSTDIVAKYTPYSFPQRWSAGLGFVNYKGPNSTERTDAVLHYKNVKGQVEYYHTSNEQVIAMASGTNTNHSIRSNGLSLNYQATQKISVQGTMDYNLIEQQDTSARRYDLVHEFIGAQYSPWKAISFYGKFHYWYYVNEDRQGPAWLFFPGANYTGKIFKAHLSLRISKSTVHPIAEFTFNPKAFYLGVYTKARSTRLALSQSANQYMGIKTGLRIDAKRHLLDINVHGTYDIVPDDASSITPPPVDPYVSNDSYEARLNAEYRFKAKQIELYTKATFNRTFNPREGYYHPERSIITAGMDFTTKLAKGSLLLDGDLNAQYIIHDDPNNVAFNPSTLSYTLLQSGALVSDWKLNLNLNAHVQTFVISLNLSTPLKLGEDVRYYLYEGIYTSSDLAFGNTFYAGLNLQWFWWK